MALVSKRGTRVQRTPEQRRADAGARIKARAVQPWRGAQDVTAQATANGEFVEPGDTSGMVKGSMFEWNAGLFFDPESGAYYDRGQYEARDYDEMLRVYPKARALEQVLTLPIRSAGWKLVPGKGDTGEAEQTEEQMRRPPHNGGMLTPIAMVLGQMTSAFTRRRSFHAKGLKLDPLRTDGTVMWSQLAVRPASTCRLLREPDSGAFAGFEQDLTWYSDTRAFRQNAGMPIQFKPHESLVYIHGQHRDPVGGVSDMEVVYWCWKTQQKLLFLWLSYLEGVALPRTIIKHNGDEPKAAAAARQIAKLKSSGVAYIDMQAMSLDVLDLSGKGPTGFVEGIRYLDTAASGSVMATFTDLGAAAIGDSAGGARGSYALSKDQTDFFLQGREAVAAELAACITTDVVAPLVRLNYGPAGVCPTFTFDPLAGVDEQPIMNLLLACAAAPATALPAEFINEIIIEAARILSLDVEKVTAAVNSAAEQARRAAAAAGAAQLGQQVAGVAGATDKLTQIAKTAKAAKAKA